MPNPVFVDCPEGQYTKIATGVTSGIVWRVNGNVEYLYTYRLTTEAAPTLLSDAVRIFKDDDESDNQVSISASASIDIYIWCAGGPGRVRVDV